MEQHHCQIYATELPDIANTVARSSILLTLLVIVQLSLFVSQVFGMFESLTTFWWIRVEWTYLSTLCVI